MNLDEFISILEQDVPAFKEHWRKQHSIYTTLYPMELGDIDDWYEQFEHFTIRVD